MSVMSKHADLSEDTTALVYKKWPRRSLPKACAGLLATCHISSRLPQASRKPLLSFQLFQSFLLR